jgi:hypothetical protein
MMKTQIVSWKVSSHLHVVGSLLPLLFPFDLSYAARILTLAFRFFIIILLFVIQKVFYIPSLMDRILKYNKCTITWMQSGYQKQIIVMCMLRRYQNR